MGQAIGTEGMREGRQRMTLDIDLELMPGRVVVTDLLAVHANRQQALKLLHMTLGRLQLGHLGLERTFELDDPLTHGDPRRQTAGS